MPVQVSYPGVYVQEVPSGARTITGVSTSIGAFVGMSTRGPKNTPVQVLGFIDYTRTFGDSIAQGEMTDQVRQFFLNGGQQAYVVRVGSGIASASAVLLAPAPSTATLTLTAVSGGTNGNQLRVIVDYATAQPEATFNLTIFNEITDSSGNTSTANQELHKDLSMDPANARFVETVLAKASSLVTGKTGSNTAGTTAFSAGATQATDIIAALNAAIPASGQGKFKISRGGGPFVTISVPANVADAAALTALVNTQMQLPAGTITVSSGGPTGEHFLLFTTNQDIVLDRGDDSDVAVALGLGTAQGGIEVGLFSANRPAPTGLVSQIGSDLGQLLTFAQSLKSGWTNAKSLKLVGTGGIPLNILASDVVFPDAVAATDAMNASATGPALSLAHARDSLVAIASTITNESSQWQASVGQAATASRFARRAAGPPPVVTRRSTRPSRRLVSSPMEPRPPRSSARPRRSVTL